MKTMVKRIICAFLVIVALSSIASLSVLATNGSVTVYITNTGEKYHREKCTFLKSSHAVTLNYAVKHGYTRCSRCDPPTLGEARSTDNDPYEAAQGKFLTALWYTAKALLGLAFFSVLGYFGIGLLCMPVAKQIEGRKQRKLDKKGK